METTQGYDVKIIEYAAFMEEVQPRSILKKNPKKVEFENLPKWEDHYAFTTKATEENPWETTWPENKDKPFEGSWADDIPEDDPPQFVSRWEEVNFCYRGENSSPPCSWKSEIGR